MAEAEEFVYRATVAPAETDPMLQLLIEGDIEVLGLMPWSSNGTFLTNVSRGDDHAPAIYKPHSGERPLWDFPGGLWKREVALLAEACRVALLARCHGHARLRHIDVECRHHPGADVARL